MPTETCANCERIIGKLETPHLWKEHVVCAQCHAVLSSTPAETAPYPEACAMPTSAELEADLAEHSAEAYQQRRSTAVPAYIPTKPETSLGITRKQAWLIIIVGLLLAPAVVGIPLIIWGGLAEHNIIHERKRRGF
jgi:hypothetical protein